MQAAGGGEGAHALLKDAERRSGSEYMEAYTLRTLGAPPPPKARKVR